MSEIVISEFMNEAPVARLRAAYEVQFEPTLVDDRPALLESLADARGLIVRNRTQVDAELLAAAPNLRAVGRLGVGLDNIDLAACAERGVRVLPATGANDVAVAEYVLASALLLCRGAYRSSHRVAAGDWPRADMIGFEIAGQTLGLVGFGGIARKVADRAAVFGMKIIAFDPNLEDDDPAWQAHGVAPVAMHTLLASADVLTLHVPLIEATRHLIDADAIAQMKKTAVIVNSARGGVIDDAALAAALRENRLAAAAIDVFESEPLPKDSVYADLDNVVLTPHIAGVTVQSNTRVSEVTVDNLLGALAEARA